MMQSSGVSGGIVHQLLTKDNYERWSCVIQNYLQGQGLWDKVIEDHDANHQVSNGNHFPNQKGRQRNATPDIEQGRLGVIPNVSEVETEASRKATDAKALHIIQLSCGGEIVDEISHFKTAKHAWNHLSKQYGKDLNARAATEKAVLSNSLSQENKEIFRKVERGDYIGNVTLDSYVYMTSVSRRTLLHVAVIAENMENVERLVKDGGDKIVHMQDDHDDTALALVARFNGNTDIAKCMIETKKGPRNRLLEMKNKDNVIPILLAAANGHKELTTYLYYITDSNVLDETDSKNRVLLLSRCITAEIFDVALKLLMRYKDLSKESLMPSKTLESDDRLEQCLVALAKIPLAFPSGTQFNRGKQFIYNILSLEKEFKDKYQIPDIENLVRKVTTVADEKPPKVTVTSRVGFLKYLLFVNSWGWMPCKFLVRILLVLPVKHLGLLLYKIFRGIAYLFVFLNIFGFKNIYDQKYIHYQVIGILSYFCQSIVEFDDSQLVKASAYDAMLHAAHHGIIEFINAMRRANPDLLTAVDSCDRGIFSYAILYRKENVFQLIHCLHGQKEIFRYRVDVFRNNLLHLAAHLGPSSDRHNKSGAALQMQREIQWFKAVEKVVHPKFKEDKNVDGKKPYEIFTESHDDLVKAGEKWAKDTATSYTIVGTLITTIMFAAAFTVPGGNNEQTGFPIFLHDNIFTTFLIADALSLFASATSVLIFIGILTSRYAEKDFLKSLPRKLVYALFFLFLSICSMIVVFCAAIDMLLKGYQTHKWFIVVPIMSLGSIPIMVLLLSQLRLMKEIVISTWKNPIPPIKK